jgi:hypothetical protein
MTQPHEYIGSWLERVVAGHLVVVGMAPLLLEQHGQIVERSGDFRMNLRCFGVLAAW